jgi:cytoskeletal protein RodZ
MGGQKMQNLFKKFNSKIVIIGIVSAIVVILCVVGVVIGVNSKNSKESNKTKNDKKVELETTSIKETQTNKNTEESMDTALSTENVTEESDTEEASENVTEEAEENNGVEDNDSNEQVTEAPATPSPEPSPEQAPGPSPEPSPEPATPQEDHIVYKADGSIDLNESYWVKSTDASRAIGKSKEFQSLMGKYYNQYGGNNIHFSIQRISSSTSGTYCVYDYSYFCTLFNDKNQIVHFTFNGSEFVEK